ncbi:hypothetical protein TcasGA2_TC011342 [Tribolium castaneum]|uniref:Uncharacterized protein n=1 Tax=Tribolium castaneum TaxID=7070 RepID=D6X427_TRICA|nr:hypothetical protein TcasGA2_TC011342 [Tribolium castaneum]
MVIICPSAVVDLFPQKKQKIIVNHPPCGCAQHRSDPSTGTFSNGSLIGFMRLGGREAALPVGDAKFQIFLGNGERFAVFNARLGGNATASVSCLMRKLIDVTKWS